ncbi:MAG: Mrp/NBP35 family ATP-binding protein [Candidatus Aenigmarchaeota archaeon]|nr:Mrp/NBP35 family ATP-binding protein [Candidatus Aenigmarchaeota archaeon]
MEVKNTILVLSGKGGVGKTTVAVNLAYELSRRGFKTGLMDVDIHGPNVPKMLGMEEMKPETNDNILPIMFNENLYVMSIAFFLEESDSAILWRGPLKHKLIRQFVEDVEWGKLDYLVVDFPPGTGDEPLSISQLLKNITGSVIVSTPQQVALLDVAKAVNFSERLNIPVIGIIENMSGGVFGSGGVEKFAKSKGINFLGSLKLDKMIAESGDLGEPFIKDHNSDSSKSFEKIVDKVISFCNQ